MGDQEMSLIMRIRSLFEGSGAKEATDAQTKLSTAAKAATAATGQGSKAMGQAGQAAGRAAEMVGSLSSAMGASSPAAAQMGAGMRVLKSLIEGSSAGLLGMATVLVGVALSAWTAYQKKVEDSKKKIAEFLDALTDKKIETGKKGIDAIGESFGRVEKAINSLRAAQNELAAAWQDLNKAGQEVSDMELQRSEKEELSRVAAGDDAGAVAVKNRYAKIREDVSVSNRSGDAFRAEQAARDDLEAASAKRINTEETLSKTKRYRDVAGAQLESSGRRADPVFNSDAEDRKRATKEVAAFTNQLLQLDKAVSELTDSLESAKSTEKASGIKLQAAQVRGTKGVEAASALASQNQADLDRDTARAKWGQQLGDLRSRASAADSALAPRAAQFRAASDAYDPQRGDYPDQGEWNKAKIRDHRMDSQAKGAEKLSESAQKLNEQLASMKPEQLATVFNSITAQLAKLDAAIKNAESRSKNQ